MKKNILSICLTVITLTACNKHKSDIPVFDLLLSDSTTLINSANIPGGRPIVMLFFSPTCNHCQQETRSILKSMDSLRLVNFYLVTIDPMEDMRLFSKVFKLSKYQNIIIGRDYKFFFPAHFKSISPPCTIIYDGDKTFRARIEGQTDGNQLIQIINKL